MLLGAAEAEMQAGDLSERRTPKVKEEEESLYLPPSLIFRWK